MSLWRSVIPNQLIEFFQIGTTGLACVDDGLWFSSAWTTIFLSRSSHTKGEYSLSYKRWIGYGESVLQYNLTTGFFRE